MSRYVKISSIGDPPFPVPKGISDDNACELVLNWIEKNLEKALWDKPDIIALPETVASPAGYTLQKKPGYFEKVEPLVFKMVVEKAKKGNCSIVFPGYVREGGKIFNAQRLIDRRGNVTGCYKKSFPIIPEIEMGITPGGEQELMKSDVGTIAGSICFDLNFYPILFYTASLHPEIIIFSSMYHGGLMQQVWAYFCRAHFVGSVSGKPNAILNPTGLELYTTTNYFNVVTGIINLDGAMIHWDFNFERGGRFEKAKKYYGPDLQKSEPGYLDSVYITSESKDFTIEDVIKRFEFEKLDDYFRRSIDHNAKARGYEFLTKI